MSANCRLYLISPPIIEDVDAFAVMLGAALDAGDVAALQIRLKDAPQAAISAVVAAVRTITLSHNVALLLNDDPHLAAQLACDGVHIGQSDAPLSEARRIVGAEAIIGVTCHDSRHLAMEAAENGADYVAFGAFFPTTTKAAPTTAHVETLAVWQETMLTPCVAIGGITVDNCRPIVAAGADFLAVSAGVWRHPSGPAQAVGAFTREIAWGMAQRPSR
jgi:thiamine-phosphate pyrophosphorylase